MQMDAVAAVRARGSHHSDGYRSIIDWMAARADVSHRTARRLCMDRYPTGRRFRRRTQLASGEISFDRAEQVPRLPVEHRSDHDRFDIAQLRRRVAHYRRLTPRRERQSTSSYLNFRSSLDEMTVSIWGELTGVDSRTVEKAVDQQADQIIAHGDGQLSVAERRALALVAICTDSLYSGTDTGTPTPPVELSVTVDARTAAETNGETGVAVLNGPRIGTRALQEVLCDATISVVGITGHGQPLSLGRKSRTIPRRLKRHVLERDGGCAVEGCSSYYRLEVHHIQPFSEGGPTVEWNLITLCWYHHHIAVHQQGLEIQQVGTSRIRLKRPT